jgi:hypothetical protein
MGRDGRGQLLKEFERSERHGTLRITGTVTPVPPELEAAMLRAGWENF